MPEARLEVTDSLGRRLVPIGSGVFGIGRREGNELRLSGSEISRDHAEIKSEETGYVVRDRGSRYGTFVNDEQITEHTLAHGDRIRLGGSGGAELVFLSDEDGAATNLPSSTVIGDLRQVSVLLEGLRALGSGRVLDDVLTMVLDSAIEVGAAERGFIMLAGAEGALEFKLARGHGRVTLSGSTFETSRKIPEDVFDTGESRMVADLLDGDLAAVHMGTVALGIRHVLCVPLRLVRYLERADIVHEEKRIGVLYLDSRERGALLANSTRAALETLATEAAVAIENARLYRETLEKARLDQEMRIAAEIQQALLPKTEHVAERFEAAAQTIPCRSIGGDFFEYLDLPDDQFGFALGDVAGKGPPAALLSALLQGFLAAEVGGMAGPATSVARMNQTLLRRAIGNRFVTVFYGVISEDGGLTYCNAGHNPPFLISGDEVRRLETGGSIVGLFEASTFAEESIRLRPGDWIVLFSDGVSEAMNTSEEEFGDDRLLASVLEHQGYAPRELLDELLRAVREFTEGAVQNDDVTALVIHYRG